MTSSDFRIDRFRDPSEPPPVRSLVSDGIWDPSVSDDVRKKYENPRDVPVEKRPISGWIQTAKRPVGRPRVENPKHKPIQNPGIGRGGAARIPHVTIDAIIHLLQQGKSVEETGKLLGCSRDTIYVRLRRSRNNPAAAAHFLKLITCPCGLKKICSRELCRTCAYKKRYGKGKGEGK